MDTNTNLSQDKHYEIKHWDDEHLDLDAKLLRGIYAHGFENPSKIQRKTLHPMTATVDLIKLLVTSYWHEITHSQFSEIMFLDLRDCTSYFWSI